MMKSRKYFLIFFIVIYINLINGKKLTKNFKIKDEKFKLVCDNKNGLLNRTEIKTIDNLFVQIQDNLINADDYCRWTGAHHIYDDTNLFEHYHLEIYCKLKPIKFELFIKTLIKNIMNKCDLYRDAAFYYDKEKCYLKYRLNQFSLSKADYMIEHLSALYDDFRCFPIYSLGFRLLDIAKEHSNKSPKDELYLNDFNQK